MAPRKQIVDSSPTTRVRFLKNDVHSGEEHRMTGYRLNEVADIPRHLADILISKQLAAVADDSSAIQAAARGKELEAKAVQAAQKHRASVAQMQFDDLPPEIRALAREFGDDPVQMYQAGETVEDIVRAYTQH